MSVLIPIPTLDEIAADGRRLEGLGADALAALSSKTAAVQAMIAAAQMTVVVSNGTANHRDSVPEGDRLLSIEEAASKTGLSYDQLYRRRDLPFRVHVGKKQLRFSAVGIERWIRRQTVKPRLL